MPSAKPIVRATLPPGIRVLGDYIIERAIERGPRWSLYVAWHATRVRERYLIRALRRDVMTQPFRSEAFAREANLLERLSHPGIVPLASAGVDNGVAAIVLPDVPGHTLRDRLGEPRRGIALAEVSRLARELGAVLDYLHAREPAIVHRGIEPAKVWLADEGSARLLDVAYAHALRVSRLEPTDDEGRAPPAYRAPEDVRWATRVGPRADQFSLACVVYECLVGAPPFGAEGLSGGGPTARPAASRERPEVPLVVDGVLARAWAADPAERYSTAGEFAAALAAALDGRILALGVTDERDFAEVPTLVSPLAQVKVGQSIDSMGTVVAPSVPDPRPRQASIAPIREQVRSSDDDALDALFDVLVAGDPSIRPTGDRAAGAQRGEGAATAGTRAVGDGPGSFAGGVASADGGGGTTAAAPRAPPVSPGTAPGSSADAVFPAGAQPPAELRTGAGGLPRVATIPGAGTFRPPTRPAPGARTVSGSSDAGTVRTVGGPDAAPAVTDAPRATPGATGLPMRAPTLTPRPLATRAPINPSGPGGQRGTASDPKFPAVVPPVERVVRGTATQSDEAPTALEDPGKVAPSAVSPFRAPTVPRAVPVGRAPTSTGGPNPPTGGRVESASASAGAMLARSAAAPVGRATTEPAAGRHMSGASPERSSGAESTVEDASALVVLPDVGESLVATPAVGTPAASPPKPPDAARRAGPTVSSAYAAAAPPSPPADTAARSKDPASAGESPVSSQSAAMGAPGSSGTGSSAGAGADLVRVGSLAGRDGLPVEPPVPARPPAFQRPARATLIGTGSAAPTGGASQRVVPGGVSGIGDAPGRPPPAPAAGSHGDAEPAVPAHGTSSLERPGAGSIAADAAGHAAVVAPASTGLGLDGPASGSSMADAGAIQPRENRSGAQHTASDALSVADVSVVAESGDHEVPASSWARETPTPIEPVALPPRTEVAYSGATPAATSFDEAATGMASTTPFAPRLRPVEVATERPPRFDASEAREGGGRGLWIALGAGVLVVVVGGGALLVMRPWGPRGAGSSTTQAAPLPSSIQDAAAAPSSRGPRPDNPGAGGTLSSRGPDGASRALDAAVGGRVVAGPPPGVVLDAGARSRDAALVVAVRDAARVGAGPDVSPPDQLAGAATAHDAGGPGASDVVRVASPAGSRDGAAPPYPSPAVQFQTEREVTQRVEACPGHFGRHARVEVTYDGATGAPSAIAIAGTMFSAPPIGSCIEAAIRAVPVPPFSRPVWVRSYVFTMH